MSSIGFPFAKMQAVGNDFVVLEETDLPADTEWSRLAIELCHRRFGVGADGLMLIEASATADLRMRMFNPDGTEDMCGNGMRCVLHRAHETGKLGDTGTIETIAGIRPFTRHTDGSITTAMGKPQFDPTHLPMQTAQNPVLDYPIAVGDEVLPVSVVSTGSLHTVVFVEELPGDDRFFRLSPLLENAPVFPERTSVMWTQVEAKNRLRLRIWERGVGETLGCGTGASAAAVLARTQGKVAGNGTVTVSSAGGELRVEWEEPGSEVYLTGYAQTVFTGTWISTHHD
ncbi:MAG: diaminopimelate epimerase [Armatimonadaceae bacterium]